MLEPGQNMNLIRVPRPSYFYLDMYLYLSAIEQNFGKKYQTLRVSKSILPFFWFGKINDKKAFYQYFYNCVCYLDSGLVKIKLKLMTTNELQHKSLDNPTQDADTRSDQDLPLYFALIAVKNTPLPIFRKSKIFKNNIFDLGIFLSFVYQIICFLNILEKMGSTHFSSSDFWSWQSAAGARRQLKSITSGR